MTNYLSKTLAPPTQREAAPGTVENSAGGQSFEADAWQRLRRFLILGSEGGSYYASERELSLENVKTLRDLVRADGTRFVDETVAVSVEGRAPKNDPAILALALAAAAEDEGTRHYALSQLSAVCRTGTHLFTFLEFVQKLRGWGRGLRTAIGAWYLTKDADALGYQIVKYRQRGGWTHRDALRLAHPIPRDEEQARLLSWAAGKGDDTASTYTALLQQLQTAKTPEAAAFVIRTAEGKAVREMVKPEHLGEAVVQEALLRTGMPLTAMIRNLGNLTRLGVLTPGSQNTADVVSALSNEQRIRKARVHPIAVLTALRTYAAGHGFRGDNSWVPVPSVVDALDEAFYTAFGNVESTGKRIMLALDVSGSMTWGEVAGVSGLTPRDATAALALVTAHTEPNYSVYGFATQFMPLAITRRQRLDGAIREVSDLPFGGTDCSLPMQYARVHGLEVDAFVVYTDSETWAGRTHPDEALRQYRRSSGIDAKLIVVGMIANRFTIADPKDPGMLDVVGFDTSTPQAISEFIR
jgi:60 kDa SS-A/Ro ribonucleoprotein